MGDTTIQYGEFGFNTFKREICAALGEGFWNELTKDLPLPDLETESQCGCQRMANFMARFEQMAAPEQVNTILCKVRHGLHPSQSQWAREKFLAVGDLDAFLAQHRQSELDSFTKLNKEHEDFYGQPITDEVLAFIKAHPSMLAPVRKGNKLYCMAFPSNMSEYLKQTDERMKRYHACHCPFAKESILTDRPVSPTLCHCSLGHVMNFVEAFLDRPLEGKVLRAVLGGDMTCEYEITLPPDVMEAYVHDDVKGE